MRDGSDASLRLQERTGSRGSHAGLKPGPLLAMQRQARRIGQAQTGAPNVTQSTRRGSHLEHGQDTTSGLSGTIGHLGKRA